MWRSLVVLVVSCGNGTSAPPNQAAAPPIAPTTMTTPTTSPEILALNRRAADGTLDRNGRCAAVFELFDKHLAAGATAATARGVLVERGWIVVDEPVTVLGGWIPVDLNFDDSTFVVHCYAEPTPAVNNQLWSDWVIYGRIAGKRATRLREFLTAPDDTKLVEFALVYPDGRIEQYAPKGRNTIRTAR